MYEVLLSFKYMLEKSYVHFVFVCISYDVIPDVDMLIAAIWHQNFGKLMAQVEAAIAI